MDGKNKNSKIEDNQKSNLADHSVDSSLQQPVDQKADTLAFVSAVVSIVFWVISIIGFIGTNIAFFGYRGDSLGALGIGVIFGIFLLPFALSVVMFAIHSHRTHSQKGAAGKIAKYLLVVALVLLVANTIMPSVAREIDRHQEEQSIKKMKIAEAAYNNSKTAAADRAISYIDKYSFYYISLENQYGRLETKLDENKKDIIVWTRSLPGYGSYSLIQTTYVDQSPIPNRECYAMSRTAFSVCGTTTMTFKGRPVYSAVETSNSGSYVMTDGAVQISFKASSDTKAQDIISHLKAADTSVKKELLKQSDINALLNSEQKLH